MILYDHIKHQIHLRWTIILSFFCFLSFTEAASRRINDERIMERAQLLYRNSSMLADFIPVQFHVTPWVREPSGYWQPFVFNFETVFLNQSFANAFLEQLDKWWWLSIVLSIIYVCLVFYGTSLMKNRKPYETRTSLIMWNVSLAIFSSLGAIRSVPCMLYSLKYESLYITICDRSQFHSITTFWWVHATDRSEMRTTR